MGEPRLERRYWAIVCNTTGSVLPHVCDTPLPPLSSSIAASPPHFPSSQRPTPTPNANAQRQRPTREPRRSNNGANAPAESERHTWKEHLRKEHRRSGRQWEAWPWSGLCEEPTPEDFEGYCARNQLVRFFILLSFAVHIASLLSPHNNSVFKKLFGNTLTVDTYSQHGVICGELPLGDACYRGGAKKANKVVDCGQPACAEGWCKADFGPRLRGDARRHEEIP